MRCAKHLFGSTCEDVWLARRLASGDADGCVVVWNVLTQSAASKLEDALTSGKDSGKEHKLGDSATPVQGLAWTMGQTCLLAVLLAPASLVLWDPKGMDLRMSHAGLEPWL